MTSVIVVGAGIVGMYSALRLAQLGAHVTLLEAEAEDFGGHGPAASLAAAGMLAPISEAFAEEGAHPNLAELGLASFDLWREQAKGAIWEDGVRFDGAAFVARDAPKPKPCTRAPALLGATPRQSRPANGKSAPALMAASITRSSSPTKPSPTQSGFLPACTWKRTATASPCIFAMT
jgi:glycine/D-amino acid oxidase-like deaminating enzyme